MRLARRIPRTMRVLMMLVVHVAVRMYQCFVRVEVLVPRGEA
jgi:hypothetical protein